MRTIFLLALLGLQTLSWGQNLTGQVFILTDNIDDEKCEITEGCDCCSSDLFFLNDREFGFIARCIYNDSYYKGTYLISQGKLVLTFKTKMVNEIVDEFTLKVKNEIGKAATHPIEFQITKCGNRLKLVNPTRTGLKRGIRYELITEKEKIKDLKNTRAWKLLSE